MQEDMNFKTIDLEAEESVLGAMFLSGDAIIKAQGIVTEGDFSHVNYQTIFSMLVAMHAQGRSIDPLTVRDFMGDDAIAKLGGLPTIYYVCESVPTAAHVEHHAIIVLQCSMQRKLIEVVNALGEDAKLPAGDELADLIERFLVVIE